MSFSVQHLSSTIDPNLSFLSYRSGNNIIGMSNKFSDITKPSVSILSPNSEQTFGLGDTTLQSQLWNDKAWGIDSDNPVIDDNLDGIRAYNQSKSVAGDGTDYNGAAQPDVGELEYQQENVNELADSAADNIPEVYEGIAEAAEVGESSTPFGIAAVVAQQLGSGLNQAMNVSLQNKQSQDYIQNINQHGVNVALNSDLIRQGQQQTIDSRSAGGTLGALLGPLGAVIGRSIAGDVQQNSDYLNTDGSFSGWVNPSDTSISQSASTESPSGESTMIDTLS